MPQATQVNPPVGDDWAVAAKIQIDLATLFDIINRLDVENFNTPGNQFSWNSTQLKNLLDATDTQDAVTLAQLNAVAATISHGNGTVTQHADVHFDGSDRFNFCNSVGGPLVKSYTVTGDQRAALDGAASPSAANPFATMADVSTGVGDIFSCSATAVYPTTTNPSIAADAFFTVTPNAVILDTGNIDCAVHAGTGIGQYDIQASAQFSTFKGGNLYRVACSSTDGAIVSQLNGTVALNESTWTTLIHVNGGTLGPSVYVKLEAKLIAGGLGVQFRVDSNATATGAMLSTIDVFGVQV